MRLLQPSAHFLFVFSLFATAFAAPAGASRLVANAENTFLGATINYSAPAQYRFGATVSVTGRVNTPEGRPIKGAVVVLKDAETNQVVRSTYSSSFGYYRLDQIVTGRSYVLSVNHRRYLFAFPAQLLEINEDRSGVDFTGESNDD